MFQSERITMKMKKKYGFDIIELRRSATKFEDKQKKRSTKRKRVVPDSTKKRKLRC